MSASMHEYELLIVESHLDTFGHVNNATYLQLFEEARWDLITHRGYGTQEVQETRLGPVILESHVKYRREVKNRERITIRTQILEYRGRVGRLSQNIFNADGQLASDAVFKIALWDIDTRKLVTPTPKWAAALMMAPYP